MAALIRVGKSTAADEARAAREAAAALAGGPPPGFVLALATPQYEADALAREISCALGEVPWAGCCSTGVFAGGELMSQGLVLGALPAEGAHFGIGVAGPVSAEPRIAGAKATAQALGQLPSSSSRAGRALLVFPDTGTGDAAEVVRGAAWEAGSQVAWAGGGSGDNFNVQSGLHYAEGRAWHDHVVVVALELLRPIGSAVAHGMHPYGPFSVVTRARGSQAVQLNFRPAFEVYRRDARRQGESVTRESFAAFAMTHPLGIPQMTGSYLIRDPLQVEPDGALRCVGEIPDGTLLRVMEGTKDDLVAAAHAAAATAQAAVSAPLQGALVFECFSRRALLEERFADELSAIQKELGADVPMLGCLTFGEVGAIRSAVPQFHNKAAVVVALPG